MAGNSIATDRNFIARDMTTLDDFLHYRMIDVSSVKELSRRWYPRAYFQAPAKQGGHRALADITESINELAYYRAAVFVPPPGPDTATAKAIAATFSGDAEATPAPLRPEPIRSRITGAARLCLGYYGRGGCSSAGRAPRCGRGCRGFESRHSPH